MTYAWQGGSTYVQNPPPIFDGITKEPALITDIENASGGWACSSIRSRPTTSRLRAISASPRRRGSICRRSGRRGRFFNQYGTRRGNHEIMMRGTFANIRIKNQMVKGRGRQRGRGWLHHPPPLRRADVHL